MSLETWVSTDGATLRRALEDALEWCEHFNVVADAPASDEGQVPFWQLVLQRRSYLGTVTVASPEAAEPWLLDILQGAGYLRLFADEWAHCGNFVWCVRGVEMRVLVASGQFGASRFEGTTAPWVYFGGVTADLPDGVADLVKSVRTNVRRPDDPEIDALTSKETKAPVYHRELRSVRDVVDSEALRGLRSFFDLDEDTQVLALWSALLGEATLDLEQAIRLSAQRLRAQGWLDFQALRHAGEIYKTIEERLLAARRSSDLFDRPKGGHIRAIETDPDSFTAEDWRDCLMGGLGSMHRVDRPQALRLAFNYAQSVYGLGVQRLRAGGRAERAIKSAINSAIRQGYLVRDGAVHLVRLAELGEPVQRGTVERLSVSDVPLMPAAGVESPTSRGDSVAPPEPATVADERTQESIEASVAAPTVPTSPPETSGAGAVDVAVDVAVAEVPGPGDGGTSSAAEATVPSLGPTIFERNLYELEFPTRALNWAERNGISTIGELVAWDPASFASERNVGRLTLRQTRAAVEEAVGMSWEEAWAAHHGRTLLAGASALAPEADEEAITAGGGTGWHVFAASLDDDLKSAPLVDVELPTRMRNFVAQEGITTIGELLSRPYNELRDQPNLGRKSLNDTLDAIQEYKAERHAPVEHATFLEAWRAQLANLKPLHRMIVSRRSGLHGTQETLEELGTMLGVSRERVRQIEARVVERLQQKGRWRKMVQRRLEAAFGGGRAVPLEALSEEPWWRGIDREEHLLAFLMRRVFDGEYELFGAPSGRRYVVKFRADDYEAARRNALERISRLEFPTEYATVLAIIQDECSRLDSVLLEELEAQVREQVLISADGEQATGFGANFRGEVLAFLNAQPEPVPVAELEARVGRGRLPEEVLYFKRGVVGLKKHFPEFDVWGEKLVPAAIAVMSARPVGRQWLVPEIHEELSVQRLVPDWLGHWHLASLLRLSGEVEYLGRLRVALKGSGQQERLHFEELLLELLEDAGQPLALEELLRRARQQTDIRDETAQLMVLQAPFVRLDAERIGLVDRDVPGAPESVVAAIEAVTDRLESSQRGLTPHQATELVNALSETHRSWNRHLVLSVLRGEPTLRIDRSKNIGLDAWDDARCPTRAEFVRREVQRAGGRLSIAVLNGRMVEVYGRAPDMGALSQFAAQVGVVRSGEVLVRSDAVEVDGPVSRPSTSLAGIPAELRERFDELARGPLTTPSELRAQVNAHEQAFKKEHEVNEFVELATARALAKQCRQLLDRWDQWTTGERQLAHAAIRYFVIEEDAEADFDIGGLDDDQQIMNAVIEYLGPQDDPVVLAVDQDADGP